MKENTNQSNKQNTQNSNMSNSSAGISQQNRPKGAEQMDESLDRPKTDNHQKGDSSRYANTSDNENYGNRS